MSYNTHHARGKNAKGEDVSEMVVVAVKASKEISKIALVWALTHVARPGDCIILLVVIPSESSGRRSWLFPRLSRGCAGGLRESQFGTLLEQKSDIADSCSQMMLKLKDVYDIDKINIKIKVVSGSKYGAVAAESKRVQANWVVLDKHLKHEEKSCINDLQCNIVVMKNSQPKVLRLNLVGSHELEPPIRCDSVKSTSETKDPQNSTKGLDETPISSPEVDALFTEAGNSSVSSSDPGTSPCFAMETIAAIKRQEHKSATEIGNLDVPLFDTGIEGLSPAKVQLQPRMPDIVGPDQPSSKDIQDVPQEFHTSAQESTAEALMDKFSKLDKEAEICSMRYKSDLHFSVNVREAISLSKSAPPGPPPLCSVCQHKAPVFGKPPRWFSYSELEVATGGFSQANFLAEGGFGSVHRGVLPDGQAIAVKQHKLASSQGDQEFCSEVEVLSCAQHRNVVMLIGFCVEDQRRLLVYEYICNGSLDTHLYGCNREPLEWAARQKIAVGAARGLRYLHEECRVGCIVHRDMRPNNILLTHDFEPLVGDFGLARWQPDGDLGVLTRVIGTFGYLAPEYALSGQITEKADVYSFGVVLLELVTGRKAVDINRPKGQHCLTEWARPLLEEAATGKLIDPRLGKLFSDQEIRCMMHAASLCIRRDPHIRPRMSQVLRILEGDMVIDSSCCSMPVCTIGNMSRRMWLEQQQQQQLDNPIEKQDSESVSIGMSSPGQQQQQLDCPIEKQDSEALPVGTSPLEQQQQQLDSPIEKQDAEALPVGTSSLEQQQQQLDGSIEKQDSEALLVETSSLETSSLEQQQQQLDRPIEKHSEALLVETSSLEQQQLQQLDSTIEKQDSEALLVETSSLEQQQLQQLNSPIEKSDLEALSVGTSFPEQQQLVSSIGKQDSEVSSVTSYEAFVC